MGLTNEILFEYARDENGNVYIAGEAPIAQIFDADQNTYMQQRGMQDQLMVQIREEVGMPANGLSAWWYGADEAKILESVANLENPDHVMLALQVAPKLDAGTQTMLDTLGKGTPEFRAALQSSLQNPIWRANLLTGEGAEQIAAAQEALASLPLPEGTATTEAEQTTVLMTGLTKSFTTIGEGKLDGQFDSLPDVVATDVYVAALNQGVDKMVVENPAMAELSDVLKEYPEVTEAIMIASSEDKTVNPGIEKMLNGEGGLEIGQLKEMLQDPEQRQLFVQVMGSVAERGDVQFEHAVTLANQVKTQDYAGIQQSLAFMGIEGPDALGQASQMGMIGGMLQSFMQSEFGQMIMGFINPLLEGLGFNGGINGMMENMGISFQGSSTGQETPRTMGVNGNMTAEQVAAASGQIAANETTAPELTRDMKAVIGGYNI